MAQVILYKQIMREIFSLSSAPDIYFLYGILPPLKEFFMLRYAKLL